MVGIAPFVTCVAYIDITFSAPVPCSINFVKAHITPVTSLNGYEFQEISMYNMKSTLLHTT